MRLEVWSIFLHCDDARSSQEFMRIWTHLHTKATKLAWRHLQTTRQHHIFQCLVSRCQDNKLALAFQFKISIEPFPPHVLLNSCLKWLDILQGREDSTGSDKTTCWKMSDADMELAPSERLRTSLELFQRPSAHKEFDVSLSYNYSKHAAIGCGCPYRLDGKSLLWWLQVQ